MKKAELCKVQIIKMQIREENFKSQINRLFDELGINNNEPLLIHSALYELYLLEKPQNKLWNYILKFMNDGVGIAIPTYCLEENFSYNPSTSKTSLGAFSQYSLTIPNGIRTYCPIHNHLFVNEQDIEPSKMNFYESFGSNTDFDFLLKKNYKMLLISVDFEQACSYIHNLEYLAKVPYRKIININRKIILRENHDELNIKFKYYARRNDAIKTDFNRVIPYLKKCSTFRKSKLSIFNSYAISLQELNDIIHKMLKNNPNIFLK